LNYSTVGTLRLGITDRQYGRSIDGRRVLSATGDARKRDVERERRKVFASRGWGLIRALMVN